jgi:hypothetical protein
LKYADGNYVVKTVEKVQDMGGGHSLLEIGFEGQEETVAMFGVYADVMAFLNQEVIASFREEMIGGKSRQCVNNLTVMSRISVLDREEDIKLYINDLPDTGSTVNFEDIQLGDYVQNAIAYCSFQIYDSSGKANWSELTLQDKRRNTAKVKLFDPDRKTVDLVGRYVKMDLKRNKFGFNTTDIEPMEGIHISPNPELELAKRFILQTVKNDAPLQDFMDKSKILTALSSYNDAEEAEVGYMLVRVAMEMAQAREYKNMSPIVDTSLLIRAILFNRGYCLAPQETNMMSYQMQNIINGSSYGPKLMSKKMMTMLEAQPRVDLLEWEIYQQIRKSIDILIKARKFRAYTLSSDKKWG